MTSSTEGHLPDVNVWITLASDRHEHHEGARRWFVYRRLAGDERVRFAPEPPNLESTWIYLVGTRTSGSGWTDAYLAAFALESGLCLITFDAGMRRWPSLRLHLLAAS